MSYAGPAADHRAPEVGVSGESVVRALVSVEPVGELADLRAENRMLAAALRVSEDALAEALHRADAAHEAAEEQNGKYRVAKVELSAAKAEIGRLRRELDAVRSGGGWPL